MVLQSRGLTVCFTHKGGKRKSEFLQFVKDKLERNFSIEEKNEIKKVVLLPQNIITKVNGYI